MSSVPNDSSADLLRSLHLSIARARRATETYLEQLEAEEEVNPDIAALKPQIAKLDGLIRDLQKVEKTLVQHADDTRPEGGTFDLEAARAEIERRLAGLASALDLDPPSG